MRLANVKNNGSDGGSGMVFAMMKIIWLWSTIFFTHGTKCAWMERGRVLVSGQVWLSSLV